MPTSSGCRWRSYRSRTAPSWPSTRSRFRSARARCWRLIGPSGCGKTTLLRSLNRLTELTRTASLSGRITLDGVDIATVEPTALRRRVTMVFQQPNPFPMSVFDNVAYVLREQARRRRRAAPRCGRRSRTRSARAGLLDEVADNLESSGAAPVGRSAAAAVHRPRAGRRPRGAAARRAVLGAGPTVDQGDRGSDRQAARGGRGRDRDPQPPAGLAVIADHVAFMYLGELVEYASARALFTNPVQQRTKDYVSGAFG